jgi:hypothetical protein
MEFDNWLRRVRSMPDCDSTMKVAIMQPYFLPYIGYFQLMSAVDEFMVYGDLQFTTSGWIRRNRILLDGSDFFISLPIEKAPHLLNIRERRLSDTFPRERQKILGRIETAYHKAPFFKSTMPIVEQCLDCVEQNLFDFILHSILTVRRCLDIRTKIRLSSEMPDSHPLKGKHRAISVCRALSADHYINAIGGTKLYDKNEFADEGIRLSFIQSKSISYAQFGNSFVPNLSIIDVMMFNPLGRCREFLDMYELV